MDDDSGWRELPSGQLLHVDPALTVHTEQLFDGPPPHLLPGDGAIAP